MNKFYHMSHYATAILTPAAFVLSPSTLNQPIDLILGIYLSIY
jgi:hypothetical protein